MKFSEKKGFTLVELVAVIGIIGMISTIIFSIFHFGLFMYSNGLKIEATETNGRLALEELTKSIKLSKVLISTSDITTDINFQHLYYDPGKTQSINPSNLVAYVEDYNGNRYIYAIKSNNGNKELHQLKLVDQTTVESRNKYSIVPDTNNPLITSELDLTSTDSQRLLGSQEVLDYDPGSGIIINYSSFSYSGDPNAKPKLMYDNFGEDCYLVVNNSVGDRKKIKLLQQPNYNFNVAYDSKVCEYVNNIAVEDMGTGKIDINIVDDTHSDNIETYVNIVNK